MDINHFIISGNVTRDLELRYLASGAPTVTYTVACNFVRYDAQDAKQERTDYIPVTTFGKQAERDAKYLRKGSAVTVECRVESWYQKEEKRGGFNFRAINVQYGSRGSGSAQQSDERGDPPTAGGGIGPEPDEWLRDYDAAERTAAPGGQIRTAAH